MADVGVVTAGKQLAQVRDAKAEVSFPLGDLVKDFVGLPATSPPPGSVALDVGCDLHGGRLMRLWMSRQAEGVTFGGEGTKGAWTADASGQGAIVVTCTWQNCRRSARLTNDWLLARLRGVRADFEAGRGLPIAWFPLSRLGGSRR